jgi:hypothetical protein
MLAVEFAEETRRFKSTACRPHPKALKIENSLIFLLLIKFQMIKNRAPRSERTKKLFLRGSWKFFKADVDIIMAAGILLIYYAIRSFLLTMLVLGSLIIQNTEGSAMKGFSLSVKL